MPQLTNMIISKVYEGKSGESQYGPWTIYNFYVQDSEGTKGKKKFGYMWSGKKPVPREGMKIAFMEYEVEQKGEYTNYKIKEIKFDQNQPQANEETEKPIGKKAYIDHGEVMLKLMEKAEYDKNKLFDLIILFKEGIEEITAPLPEEPEEDQEKPQEYDEMNPPPPEDSEIPF